MYSASFRREVHDDEKKKKKNCTREDDKTPSVLLYLSSSRSTRAPVFAEQIFVVSAFSSHKIKRFFLSDLILPRRKEKKKTKETTTECSFLFALVTLS